MKIKILTTIRVLHFIKGCKRSGMYGDNCDKYCLTICKDHMCHIQKGTCYACQPGWMGTTCNTSKTVFMNNIVL